MAVKTIVLEALSKKQLSVPVEVDVSYENDESHSVAVGAYGEGSGEALRLHPGDRTPDEESERRVDIEAELVAIERGVRTVTHPPTKHSGKTRDWELTITSFREIAAGVAVVDLAFELRNPESGRVATGSATLVGGGVSINLPWKQKPDKPGGSSVGKPRIKFQTDDAVGFSDFDTRPVRMGRVQAKLLVGKKYLEITFLSVTGPVKIDGGWTFGLKPALGSYSAAGRLYLDDVPPDAYPTPVAPDQVPYRSNPGSGHGAQVRFKTGSSTVSESDRRSIEALADHWAQSFT